MRKNGFSLIEAIVGVAVLGVLIFVLMELVARTLEGQRAIQQRQGANSIQQSVSTLLTDRRLCELNFAGIDTAAPGDVVTKIVSAAAVTAFEEAQIYENGMNRLRDIRLQNYRAYSTAPTSPDLFRGTMEVTLQMEPTAPSQAASAVARTVTLLVELNGTGLTPTAIRTCRAVGGDLNNVWVRKPDNSIYYMGFNVGIGTSEPAQRLHVVGNVLAYAFLHTSDERLKTNIRRAPGLAAIEKLNGVSFDWRESGKPSLGVIAQEVESVLPAAVATDPKSTMKSVSYDQLVGPLIESVKELARENRKLERRIEKMEGELETKN